MCDHRQIYDYNGHTVDQCHIHFDLNFQPYWHGQGAPSLIIHTVAGGLLPTPPIIAMQHYHGGNISYADSSAWYPDSRVTHHIIANNQEIFDTKH